MNKPTLNEIERFFVGAQVSTIEQAKTTVGFKRLTEDATIPTKAHATDSGYDLVASEDVIVEPGKTVVVKTGIAVQLPPGYEATIRPRSGVTAKTKLRVQLGTIDNGYNGEIGVIVDNIADKGPHLTNGIWSIGDGFYEVPRKMDSHSYGIRRGDRIAQLVVTKLPQLEAIEVFEVEETARGDRGFGSSGVGATE